MEGERNESLLSEKEIGSMKVQEPEKVDLSQTNLRYLVLILAVLLCFGSYFVYDNPSALQPQLMDRLNMNSLEYNMLYSVYSFPNFILPLFGGYLIDFMGIRIGITLFSSLILAGQCVFALAVDIKNYPLALIGRFIFGLGGESLSVAQSALISNWFMGKNMALAFGVNISVARLGSVANDYSEPGFDAITGSPQFGLWFGAGLCALSLICGLFLNIFDKRRDVLLGIQDKRKLDPSEKVNLKDIKQFGLSYWLITVNCLVVYACVLSFNNIASDFFQTRFGFSSVTAGFIIGITYIVAAILCPFLGHMVDKIGKRVYLILISAVCVTLSHVIFICIPDCDQCYDAPPVLVLLGFGYSVYATVMWACVPFVVEAKTVGTAFGVTTAVQNIGLGIVPLLVGVIHDNTSLEDGYFWVTFFFICMGILGIITAIFLLLVDFKNGGVLNSKDPRLNLLNNVIDDPSADREIDPDLPKQVQDWLTSPESQQGLRVSINKLATATKQQMSGIQELLNDEEKLIEVAKNAFQRVDQDQSGFIELNEFYPLITQLGQDLNYEPPSEDQAAQMLKALDENSDGKLNLNEFLSLIRRYLQELVRSEESQKLEEQTREKQEREKQNEEQVSRQVKMFEKYLEESGLTLAFQTIFAEILTKKIEPNNVFTYTAMRLRQIGKQIAHLLPENLTANLSQGNTSQGRQMVCE